MFLRTVIFLIGAGVLSLCLFVLPAGIKSDVTGYYRPLFISMYIPAIPFFIALYQTLSLLSYIDKDKAFSSASVKALKNIKYCAIGISALYILDMPLLYNAAEKDDAPGVIVIGLVIIFASIVIAVFAAVLQSLLKNAIAIKSENDLTV
jgi:hypothetical protein